MPARGHPADLPRTDPRPERRDARHAGPVLDRVPRPPAGRRRRRRARPRPADRPGAHDPGEVPRRRGRRALEGRRRRRPPDGGRDGHRRLHEHHVQGGHLRVGRSPAVGALLGDPAGLERRRDRRRAGAHGPAVERVADRLGLRHLPATARRRRGRRRPDRAEPARPARHRGRDHRHLAVGQQRDVRHPPPARPGLLRGRRRPPASAEQRPRVEHLDPGLLQPRLEARRRPPRSGRALAARDVLGGAGPGRQTDRHPGQQVQPGVRAVLRGARPARRRGRGGDGRAHRGTEGEHAGGCREAGRARPGDGAQELRVQRPRGRARAVLRLRRGRRRRQPASGAHPGPRAVLPTLHRPRARGCRTPGSATARTRSPPSTWRR